MQPQSGDTTRLNATEPSTGTSVSREDALAFLAGEPIRHFTITTLVENAPSAICHRLGDHLLIRIPEKNGTFVAFAAGSQPVPATCFTLLDGTETLFYVQGDEMAGEIAKRLPLGRTSDCVQFHLPDDVPVSDDETGIVDLKPEDAAYIHSHYTYRDVTTEAYLAERISLAPAIGILVDGVLAGFVMTHEELTMGVMHVLPEYRKLGLATRLNAAMVRRMRALGYPCIVEIVHNNHASLALAKSAGFIPLQKAHWIHVNKIGSM